MHLIVKRIFIYYFIYDCRTAGTFFMDLIKSTGDVLSSTNSFQRKYVNRRLLKCRYRYGSLLVKCWWIWYWKLKSKYEVYNIVHFNQTSKEFKQGSNSSCFWEYTQIILKLVNEFWILFDSVNKSSSSERVLQSPSLDGKAVAYNNSNGLNVRIT